MKTIATFFVGLTTFFTGIFGHTTTDIKTQPVTINDSLVTNIPTVENGTSTNIVPTSTSATTSTSSPLDEKNSYKNSSFTLVNTVNVKGTISGGYRNINKIQILSSGRLAYLKSVWPEDGVIEDSNIKETFMLDGKEIKNKNTLSPVKEINGKLAYDIKENKEYYLIYDDIKKSDVVSISQFIQVGNTVAYTAYATPNPSENVRKEVLILGNKQIATGYDFPLIKQVNGKLAYIVHDSSKSNSLIYDGKQIASTDNYGDIEEIAGKIAYITHSGTEGKDTLYYDGKEVVTADSIRKLKNIHGKLAYILGDKQKGEKLVIDGKTMSSLHSSIVQIKEIGESFAYTSLGQTSDKNGVVNSLYYNGNEMASSTPLMGWGRMSGDIITNIEDVNGQLLYVITGEESKDNLYYEGKLIATADSIGGSFSSDELTSRDVAEPFYFYTADEKDGTVIFKIYKIN